MLLNRKNFILIINLLLFIPTLKSKLQNPSYKFETEIISGSLENNIELNNEILKFANQTNHYLNTDCFDFFKTEIVRNPKKGRYLHLINGGQIEIVTTEDNEEIECTYFNRNSDQLLIIGAGFTNAREIMTPFIAMFENYDLVIFDYRGHGYKEKSWLKPWTWERPRFKVDNRKVKLGAVEEKDVFAVFDHFKNIKSYTKINGLGICYSSLIFVKAQSIKENKNEKFFDKLILDGCWLSVENFTDKLMVDPKLLFKPQTGGWSESWIVKHPCFKPLMYKLRNYLAGGTPPNTKMLDYLPKINQTPILLWYGKNDLTVTREEFENILSNINTKHTIAIITSNPHVINHLKQKELYKMICELFLEKNQKEFINCLQNVETLKNNYHFETQLEFKNYDYYYDEECDLLMTPYYLPF